MMFRRLLLVVTILSVGVLFISGCSSDDPEPVKTAADYKADAEKEIDKTNLQSELDKLEADIEADEAAGN